MPNYCVVASKVSWRLRKALGKRERHAGLRQTTLFTMAEILQKACLKVVACTSLS